MGDEEDDGGEILKKILSNQGRDKFLPPKRTRKLRTENSVIKEPSKHEKKGKISNLVFICNPYQQLPKINLFAGPWNDFSAFEMSLKFINNKNTLCYVKDMRGWYIEIYKDEKFLYSSIIVVDLNDNSEHDEGIHLYHIFVP